MIINMCSYCGWHTVDIMSIEIDNQLGHIGLSVYVDGDAGELVLGAENGCHGGERIVTAGKIHYCPMCGRELKPHAEAEG